MDIDVSLLKKSASKSEQLNNSETEGTQFKLRRMELGMTLKEASFGVCHSSSLSKFENGRESISDESRKKLYDRLRLEPNEFNLEYKEEQINLIADSYFLQVPYLLDKTGLTEFASNLCEFYSLASNRNYLEAHKLYKKLSKLTYQLDATDQAIFFLATAKLLMYQSRNRDAHNLLLEININKITNDDLKMIIELELLKTAVIVNRSLYVYKMVPIIIDKLTKGGFQGHLPLIQSLNGQLESLDSNCDVDVNNLGYLRLACKKLAALTRGIILYNCEKYLECNDQLVKAGTIDGEQTLLYRLITAARLDDKKIFDEIINSDLIKYQTKDSELIVRYLDVKFNSNLKLNVDFLHQNVIAVKKLTDHNAVLSYWSDEVNEQLERASFYKNIVRFSKAVEDIKKRASKF